MSTMCLFEYYIQFMLALVGWFGLREFALSWGNMWDFPSLGDLPSAYLQCASHFPSPHRLGKSVTFFSVCLCPVQAESFCRRRSICWSGFSSLTGPLPPEPSFRYVHLSLPLSLPQTGEEPYGLEDSLHLKGKPSKSQCSQMRHPYQPVSVK